MRYLKLKTVKKEQSLKKKQANNFLNRYVSDKTSKLNPKLKYYIQKYKFTKIEDKKMCSISFKGRSFNRKFNLSR
ncbi:MAG: hypothetical protein CMF42_01625 [Legionellales bacterium]|nr:hypothetical protein [Legionellales bacterium]|tara:strand:- start:306 stop:530 length:225 start_codon:yes stop_codon:yes gene_type:complete